MTQPFLSVEHLSYSYQHGTPLETPALHDVSLHVARGEIVGLIGATGSGKSTLLQHLCGLLHPQHGHIWVDGRDLADPQTDLRVIRQRVGLVFQSPEDQLFERYVGDDVAFGPRNLGLERPVVRERVRAALESVGLDFTAFKDRLTLTLSGGERRRVALAGVLALAPEALLLDEPTAGLDPAGRAELLDLLHRWRRDRQLTIVLSSHNMDDLAALADRIYVLDQGRNALDGPVRAVFAQGEWLRALGLDVPAMTGMLSALAAAGLPVPQDALSIDEAADAIAALWSA
jgi:energy-coupling factor transport system ATP-binding protein